MKMSDGGFRPAYNAQLAVTATAGVIVGVAVTNAGSDAQEMQPLKEQLRRRYGQTPKHLLVDGGFAKKDELETASANDSPADSGQDSSLLVYAPVKDAKKKLAQGKDPYVALKGDSPMVAAWRAWMGQPEAQALYKQRSSRVEWVNAQARRCHLYQLPVRGKAKVQALLLWFAVAHNWLVGRRLRAVAAKP